MRLLTTLQHSRALYASAASRSCTFQVRTVYALVRFRNLHLAADIACLDLNIECVSTKLLFFFLFCFFWYTDFDANSSAGIIFLCFQLKRGLIHYLYRNSWNNIFQYTFLLLLCELVIIIEVTKI